MPGFISNFHLDRLSFWIGFLTATLFWWAAVRLMGVGRVVRDRLKTQLAEAARRRKAGLDERLRRETLRKVQTMHLSASLFSLEEIAVPPLVISPFQTIGTDGSISNEDDITQTTLPYLPDWPELNSYYGTRKLTIAQALQGGANLAIIGQPGSGKTFALAYLASQVSRREPSTGSVAERLPLFIHIADLRYSSDPAQIEATDPVESIISAVSSGSPLLIQPQIPGYIRNTFTNGKALLILDGADELPLAFLKDLVAFLNALLTKYPGNQLIISACLEYLDGLISIGIKPVTLCSWTNLDRCNFVDQWGQKWKSLVEPILIHQSPREPVNTTLLNNWLLVDHASMTPLEFTLKVWSLYAGEPQGVKGFQAVESYVKRVIPEPRMRKAVGFLALQVVMSGQTSFARSNAASIMDTSEPPRPQPPEQQSTPASADAGANNRANESQTVVQTNLSQLLNTGLLLERQNEFFSFSHPVILGYLASQSIQNTDKLLELMSQPIWIGKSLLLHYLSAAYDISPQIESLIRQDASDPLMRNLLMISRWLSDAPTNAPWKVQTMRRLVNALQNEAIPPAIKARVMSAFIVSNDASLPQMFQQLMASPIPVIRHLSALGCGAVQDTKSINDLAGLLTDPVPEVRFAACMALVVMGTTPALDPVLDILVKGDEELSRVAAEAFANQPVIGHNLLKECTTFDNLLVRRASVFGLGKVNQPWSLELLKHMQIEDSQWVVRNAANQALEMLQKTNQSIPHPYQLPHDSPWLIEFASKQGMGIIPGSLASELLISAMKTGEPDERLAAMDYLSLRPGEKGLAEALYPIMYKEKGVLSDTAAYVLWLLAAAGIALPSPEDFLTPKNLNK